MSAQPTEKPDLIRLFQHGSLAGLSEWQLLDRFLSQRDESAFEALVSRHGQMVMGTCRRMLVNRCDIEDAFQATFLVLLRRARSLGPSDALGPWLHGVAVRVALQARRASAARGRRERLGLFEDVPAPDPVVEDHELRRVLDEEIDRLPSRYRLPIVLCYLEGRTHEQAARDLEWPLGTVKGRLARARAILESRLTRRGVACGVGLAALASGSGARAALPIPLVQSTCRSAVQFGSTAVLTSVVSTSVSRLIRGVIATMIMQKLTLVAAAVAVSGLLFTGVGAMARQNVKPSGTPTPADTSQEKTPPIAVDLQKEMLAKGTPHGPMNTTRDRPRKPIDPRELYTRAIQEARRAFLMNEEDFRSGKSSMDRVYLASRLLMQGETTAAAEEAGKVQAAEAHLDRMQRLLRTHEESGKHDEADGANARAYMAEAENLLAQARTQKPEPAPAEPHPAPGTRTDQRTQAVLTKLEQPVNMNFPNETPLEDVLKYIKQATQGPNDQGIPIYVDPLGLQEADKTLTSPVSIDLVGVPLKTTLRLLLKQLGLTFTVKDGFLMITSQESVDHELPGDPLEPSPFLLKQQKAERGEMTIEDMKQFVEELKLRKEMMNALAELQSIDEGGFRGGIGPQNVMESLLKEIKELVSQLKAEPERAAKP